MHNANRQSGNIRFIVPGALHTDITVVGLPRLPKSGEDSFGSELKIGPGGKSRNIADMIAHLTGPGIVAMLSHTVKDSYGLWQPPYDALLSSGVNTDFVSFADSADQHRYPGIALISVDSIGNRNASISNSIINDFTPEKMDEALPLFEMAGQHEGILALSLELPIATATHAIHLATEHGLKVILDPGGLQEGASHSQLFEQSVFLVKPNENEAKQLTGIEIVDFSSAQRAAAVLVAYGAQNVLITHGEHGAYVFGSGIAEHVPIPSKEIVGQKDATGCGDQAMAALCVWLSEGSNLLEAAKVAVAAGTQQFHKVGIKPVTKEELLAVLKT